MDAPVDGQFQDERYGPVETATSTPSVHYVNESGLPDDEILNNARFNREVASVIEKWTQSLNSETPTGSIDVFARTKWQNAKHPFALMSQCAWAVENDDILSTLADVVEGLTFKKMRFELNDDDQQDMWNQWAAEVDLDSRLREQSRELFKVSQFYVGLWWERRIYNVRDAPVEAVVEEVRKLKEAKAQAELDGTAPPTDPPPGPGKGNRKRKKKFAVEVPTAFTIFDPTKVMPVGTLMFGRERFAYIADRAESEAFAQAMKGDIVDATVMQLIEKKYDPTPADITACADVGVDSRNLWLLKENAVYRHTLTRAQYERFAPIRLKSVLPILELKQHQRNSDRASLIGNTNFLVVITKGTDKLPAKPAEIENLKEQARIIARLPVLVGDHRLEVKIVSPALDNTLQETRWNVLDSRLVFKALQSFQPIVQGGNSSAGPSEMSRVVSQSLENRRHLMVRALERWVFREILKRNEGVLEEFPSLTFAPKRITLDFSADIMNAILKLRDRGDVSRETTLDEFDYDQDVEVVRRAREQTMYDEVFKSGTPFSSPQTNPYGTNPDGSPKPPGQARDQSAPEGGRPPGVQESGPRVPKGQVKA